MGSPRAYPSAAWQGPEGSQETDQKPNHPSASHTEILTAPLAQQALSGLKRVFQGGLNSYRLLKLSLPKKIATKQPISAVVG